MKQALALCLITSTIALGADADAKPHKKKAIALSAAKPTAALALPNTADAPPPEVMKRPKASFWIAADPHVPLAKVDGRLIRSVGTRGKDCGDAGRWASPGSRWHAVDAYGQTTGVFAVSGAETFDVTQCHEVAFSAKSGKAGAGLFFSDDSGYTPGQSAAYKPSAIQKIRFEHFLAAMESSWVNQKPLGKMVPIGKRSVYFQFDLKDSSREGRVDGAGKPIAQPRRWVVAGGPILTVAYEGAGGHWKAASVKSPLGLADSYTPIAVFDMNGDGVPEIVIRANDGASFADHVLSLHADTMTWEEAAESPGGAAL